MKKSNPKERFYRDFFGMEGFRKYGVRVEETDLLVLSRKHLGKEIGAEIEKQRGIIKDYIKGHPQFYTSMKPVFCESGEEIIKLMCRSAGMTQTGPMACVAGALAEVTGRKILPAAGDLLIENGGDIFAKMEHEFTVAIYAGSSPFSLKTGLKFKGSSMPVGIATSSGTVGHSFSMGNADAVTVVSRSAALSDGAATYFGNIVTGDKIDKDVIEAEIKKFPFIEGVLVIKGREMFLWGEIEMVSF